VPVRTCLVDGRPAMRWGRRGPLVFYGEGTPLQPWQAASIVHARARGVSARRLAVDLEARSDGRRRTGWARGRPRYGDRLVELHAELTSSRLAMAERLFLDLAGPAIAEVQREMDARRADASAGGVLRILQVLRAIETVLSSTPTDEGLRYVAEEVDDDVVESTDRELSRLFTIPIASAAGSDAIVKGWVHDNVGLIKRLDTSCFNDLERLVLAAVHGGAPIRHLRDDIATRFGVHRNYASFLARDQVAKVAAKITQVQHTRYGCVEYIWDTSGDARVRQEHARLDGMIQKWAEPPIADLRGRRGHPGEVWQCRCTALAVLPDDDRDLLIAQAEARKERELRAFQFSPTVKGEIPNRSGFSDWNAARIRNLRSGVREAVGLT